MPTRPRVRCPGCKQLHDGKGKCGTCRAISGRQRDVRRGSPAQRGLGADHRRASAEVLQGATVCAKCGLPPTLNDPLQAGHIIGRKQDGPSSPENYQPEHRSCNAGKRPARRVTLSCAYPGILGGQLFVGRLGLCGVRRA